MTDVGTPVIHSSLEEVGDPYQNVYEDAIGFEYLVHTTFVVKVFSDRSPFILKWNLQAFIVFTTSALTLKVPYRIFWSNLILLMEKNQDLL